MKKSKKRIILIVAAVIVVLMIVALIIFYPMLAMSPAATGAIPGTNVYAIQNGSNAVYFVDTGEGVIMVDAGSDANALEADMAASGISVDDVKWILLTHSDYDHVAGLSLFPNAEIFMSEDELGLVNGTVNRNASGGNDLPIGLERLVLQRDGKVLMLGGLEVQCWGSPGHTIGHMAYLVEGIKGQYFFTGDAFMLSGGRPSVHPFSMDEAQAARTIDALRTQISLSEFILTGHYGYYSN